MQPGQRRSTTTRDRHRRLIARDQPPCGICGRTINYSLPHLDPESFTIHHVIPIARGGRDVLHNDDGSPQIVAAHRRCNLDQADRLPGEERASKTPPVFAYAYAPARTVWATGIPAHELPPGVNFCTGRRW